MKVAFFGTSDRSIPILESLDNNFDLELCITKSDRKVGRKHTIKECGVKTWAKENNIGYIEISQFKETETKEIIEELENKNVEYGIVADFSFMIPDKIIHWFNNKFINIHFSLLPKYRGASPVQFAILNGDEHSGISYHLTASALDSGSIIDQIKYIMPQKPAEEIYKEMFKLASEHLSEVLKKYDKGILKLKPQNETEATYTYSPSHPKSTLIYKEDAEINWTKNIYEIERQVRAYNSWPIAWTTVEKLENNVKLCNPSMFLKDNLNKHTRLKIFSAKILDGKIEPQIVQLEGKNKMDWNSFVNGYSKAS